MVSIGTALTVIIAVGTVLKETLDLDDAFKSAMQDTVKRLFNYI